MSSNFGKRPANALTWIIGINVGIFIIQCLENAIGTGFISSLFELNSANLGRGFLWTVLSYSGLHSISFLQGGAILPWHIMSNMFMTYMIGRILLPAIGTQRLVQLYLGSALTAGLFWLLVDAILPWNSSLMGASGSVSGLLIMFACLYPNQEIQLLFLPFRFKVKAIAIAALSLSALLFLTTELNGKSGTAHSAHLGGMLGGWLFYRYIYVRNVNLGFNFRMPSFLKKKPKGSTAGSQYKYKVNLQRNPAVLKKEVDRILDKINSKGFASLTAEEKDTLDNARDILNQR